MVFVNAELLLLMTAWKYICLIMALKMKTADINKLIEDFNSLHLEEKEFAVEIIRRAYAEAAREGILANARRATKNLKKGNVKRGNLKDLYNDLEK